ncbi:MULTISPECIES: rhodanese-like domain-containing protein [Collimonas]|uniref:Rhodanese-like domain protein n=1 Tax=Collimonas pratensis TaxID=279113 RepID=A0A127R3P4_9BURK|nr:MULTISPECIES: rhodanese-like domain-containing protein [Collimonas]AMP07339.1 rhodanese-like domain protein [Collimonas pratensis]AMP17074.1 rhodanese-like domain protein [Collimonas pratensis]NKI71515.1 rhodanese-like domain-containing protein [Collimonas pratensis]HWX03410.1 rhodanese-like domain-containing protein [Collimonas sp.]
MKFLIDNIFLIAVAILSGGALLLPLLQKRGNRVSTLQATQLINQGKTLVLDVRDSEAFAAAHLIDAKNIPLKDLPQRIAELDKFKAKNVLVVCQTGSQATKAVAQLSQAGFAQAYNLEGGIAAWQTQGLPTVK